MILKFFKIFSQNVFKNKLFTDTILENNKDFDIFFIQESFWSFIYSVLSFISEKGEDIVEVPNHLSWNIFTRLSQIKNKHPKVLTYINIRLIKLHFLLRKDILNYKDINLISFFNCNIMCFILIIIVNFNIRDNNWNPLYLHHFIYADILKKIANNLNLEISLFVDQVLTRCVNSPQDLNSVLDLMFLYTRLSNISNLNCL